MFRLKVFPADDGDCMLLAYGDAPPYRHVLVDGGRASTYPLLRRHLDAIAAAGEELELLVLTHIDADHIEGVLKLAEDRALGMVPKRVWFNGYDQMARLQAFGEAQGDRFSARLTELGWPMNADFANGTASIEARPEPFEIAGLRITMLSPDAAHLATMRSRWADWRTAEAAKAAERDIQRAAGLQRMGRKPMPAVLDVLSLARPTPIDPEAPNGSSIAFVAEWSGRRVLLTGDAHPDLLAKRLAELGAPTGRRYAVDLLKVSHHGSHGNTTREMVESLDCGRFLISTNGKRHGHPDPEAIARLLAYSPPGNRVLYFNYETGRTTPWASADLMAHYLYSCEFAGSDGVLTIDI